MLFQPHPFRQVEQEVHVLDGLAGGAFDEIVDSREDNDFAFDGSGKDMAIVAFGNVLNDRRLGQNLYEAFTFVEFPIEFLYLCGRDAAGRVAIDTGQDAAVERTNVRLEQQFHRLAGDG